MHPKRRFLLLLPLVAGGLACGSPPAPVGSLTVQPAEIVLPHASWRPVELTWRMSAPLEGAEGEIRALLHLLDGAGELRRTFDHPLPGEWTPGEELSYTVPVFQSAIGPPLDPGDYTLRAGLYDAAGGRWPVDPESVAVVEVSGAGEGLPELSFSADWLPVEAGGDLQILARRWLSAGGVIRIRGIDAPGVLWLRVGVPRANPRQEMALAAGAAQPEVTVTTDCGEFAAAITGAGSHTLEVPLAPAEPGGECRVSFRPNFELRSTENPEKRTIALENVAWNG